MTDYPSVRILVADDHTLLREALVELLHLEEGFDVVAQAADARAAVQLAGRTRPDVALLDIQMPYNDDPATTVRLLLQHQPDLAIIVLSTDDHPILVRQLLALGVRGYLHKSATRQTLVAAIRARGESGSRVVTVSVASEGLPPGSPGSRDRAAVRLSERELEVLVHVAAALSNRQIGARLGITEGTVKRHMRSVFDKLGAVSRIDAVNKAVALALIHPSQHRRVTAA